MARELPSPAPAAEDILAEVSGGEGVFVTDHLVFDLERPLGGKLWLRILRLAPPLGVFALVLILWQFGVPAIGIRDFQLPVPTEIWQTFRSDQGSLLNDGWFTFWNEAFRGYVIGSLLGFLIAVAAWRFRPVAKGVMPYAVLSSAVPIVALAPALVVIAGSDWQSKVYICAIMTIFPMTVNAYRGLRSADAAGRELLATYGAGEWTTFWKLNLPASLPFVFNALRINTTLAMIGAIVAEYFGSPTNGLGLFIDINAGNLAYRNVWAGVLVACVIGILFYLAVLIVERRLTRWHVSYRSGG